ncbi:hypothetical protein, partial [Desulfuromonas carbonis]
MAASISPTCSRWDLAISSIFLGCRLLQRPGAGFSRVLEQSARKGADYGHWELAGVVQAAALSDL